MGSARIRLGKPDDFPQELGEWLATENDRRRDRHAVSFLALKVHVIAGFEAGYSGRTIWRYLKAKRHLEYPYATFTRHVREFLPEYAGKGKGNRAKPIKSEGTKEPRSGMHSVNRDANIEREVKAREPWRHNEQTPLQGFVSGKGKKIEDLI